MDAPPAIFDVPTPFPQEMTTSTDARARNATIVYSTVFSSIFVLTLLVVTRVIIRKRRRTNPVLEIVASSVYSIPNQLYVSPQPPDRKTKKDTHAQKIANSKEKPQYPRRALYKNQEHPVYLVPFTALPTDFDFSSRKVQVCSDFVIVKDLDILLNYRMETPVSHHLEEYKKQTSFNPTFPRNHMVY